MRLLSLRPECCESWEPWSKQPDASLWSMIIHDEPAETGHERMHCIQMQLAKKRSWNSKDSLKDQKSRSASSVMHLIRCTHTESTVYEITDIDITLLWVIPSNWHRLRHFITDVYFDILPHISSDILCGIFCHLADIQAHILAEISFGQGPLP